MQQRIGAPDAAVQLDDARPQGVAAPVQALDQTGLAELLEVAVDTGARRPQLCHQELGGQHVVLAREGFENAQDAQGSGHGDEEPGVRISCA